MVTHGVCVTSSSTGHSATAVPPAGVRLSPSESGIRTILAMSRSFLHRAHAAHQRDGVSPGLARLTPVTATDPTPGLAPAWGPSEVPTTALLTDHYELTMLRAALRAGTASRRCVFELFARRLPEGRRYGVVAGVGRALRALRHFRFDDESLRFLLDRDIVDQDTADWLADYTFRGDIWGYAEGEIYFPGSPVLIVEGTFAEGVMLETLLLSIYNHDSA